MSIRTRISELSTEAEASLEKGGIRTLDDLAGLEAGRVPEIVKQAASAELTTEAVLALSKRARDELRRLAASQAASIAASAGAGLAPANGACTAFFSIESVRRELNDVQLQLKEVQVDVRHGYVKAAGVAGGILTIVAGLLGALGYTTVKDMFAEMRREVGEVKSSVNQSRTDLTDAVEKLDAAKNAIVVASAAAATEFDGLRSDLNGLRLLQLTASGTPSGPAPSTTNPVELTMQLQAAVRQNDIATITQIIPNLLLLIDRLTPADLHTLAWGCLSINDHDGAIRAATKGIQKLGGTDPKNLKEFDRALLASLYSKRGSALAEDPLKFDQALADFEVSIELFPLDEAYNNKSGILWRVGRFKEAVEALNESIKIDDEPTGRDNLALTLLAWKQASDPNKPSDADLLEQALGHAVKAFNAKADRREKAQSALIAAMVATAQEDRRAALDWCQQALALDPTLQYVAGGLLNTDDSDQRIEGLRTMISVMGKPMLP